MMKIIDKRVTGEQTEAELRKRKALKRSGKTLQRVLKTAGSRIVYPMVLGCGCAD
jgi:hypothetical protein